MRESPTTPRPSAELIETLARAMDFAHKRGIVHRDLKPANILLGLPSGQSSTLSLDTQAVYASSAASGSSLGDHWIRNIVPKIADFGLATRVDEDSGQTQSGAILGTPCYMAPEQAKGENKDIGPSADIYAHGAILYELLTGRPPFKAARPIDTIRQVIEQDPVPPRQLEPRVPRDLETICLKCLQKEPVRRYATATDFADDLQRFLRDEPVKARPIPAWERAWKWGRRRPTMVALCGVCVLAVLGAVGLIVWHNVSLGRQLEQARAEERLARHREEEALEGQRLSRLRGEGHNLYDEARVAASARDWPNARLHLTRQLALIGDEAGLETLREPAQTLLSQVEGELRVETARNDSKARVQQFGRLRDEAQFLGSLYTGMDLAANLRATRATVEQALAVYGVAGDAARPAFDPYLDERQKADILGDCYLLMLILAETEAQSATIVSGAESEKKVREASKLLQAALKFGSPSRGWHMRQARYRGLLGDEAGARDAQKAARAAPLQHMFDHFLLADELYRRGQYEPAIKEFEEVLRRDPGHFWAQYLNALCLLRQQRPAEARVLLGACLAQRPDFVWLYLLRGFTQGELRAYDAADADYATALKLPLDEFSRYVLLVNRGVLRIRQERYDDAVADLNAAIKLKPKEYQAYVNLAQARRQLGKTEAALAELNRAVELEPALAHLYRLRARLRLELGEPEQALKDFEEAVKREKTDSPLQIEDYVERGRLLLRTGKHADALASFDGALARDDNHSLARRLLAETLFQLGRYEEVIAAFDRYLQNGVPLESVYRGRGLARAEMGKFPAAIEDYTKALELKPTPEVLAYRAWAHLVCEAPKLALRDFEMAIELDPKHPDAYNGRGMMLARQGRRDEAARDAARAAELGAKSPRILYNVARIHAACGTEEDEQAALTLVGRALQSLPAGERADFWSKYIQNDPVLRALRAQPRFQRIIGELVPKT